jgi:hypothetical protein
MHLNTTPDPPPAKPCIRDLHELLRDHLPPATVIKSLPLPELARRCHEIAAEHRRFREEVPLVLAGEERRRHRYSGALSVASSHAEVA